MSPATETVLTAITTVTLSAAVGLGLYKLIAPRGRATTAGTLGRKWMAWVIFLGTFSTLPPFFRKLDGNSFALWLLSVVLFGGSAFFIGWVIGLFRFRRTDRQVTPESFRSATATEASDSTALGREQVFHDTSVTTAAVVAPLMYHLHYGGQNHGPYVIEQIRSMWASGIITADAVYWNETREAWEPVANLLEPPAPDAAKNETASPPPPPPKQTKISGALPPLPATPIQSKGRDCKGISIEILVGVAGLIAAGLASVIVKGLSTSTIIASVAGALVGVMCALIPYFYGRRKHPTLGNQSFWICGISGAILGLILALPMSLALTGYIAYKHAALIRRSRKPPTTQQWDSSQKMTSEVPISASPISSNAMADPIKSPLPIVAEEAPGTRHPVPAKADPVAAPRALQTASNSSSGWVSAFWLCSILIVLALVYYFSPKSATIEKSNSTSGTQLINHGDAEAQYNLGVSYRNGTGVEKNIAEAVKWYRKAAEQGHAMAQCALGNRYYSGEGVVKDYAEAAKWYRKAAEQNLAEAQSQFGLCYDYGDGVEKNQAEAVKWYRKAAEQNLAVAQRNLGYSYHDGTGVPKDYTEAVKWFRKAAEQGQPDARFQIGLCYYRGAGVEKNYAEAVKWFRMAADQGDADAQNYLGACYRSGAGVSQDKTEAVKWFRKAAEQGAAEAQKALSDLQKNAPPARASAKPKPRANASLDAKVAASEARARVKCPEAFKPGSAMQSSMWDFAFHYDQTKAGWRDQGDWPEQLIGLITHYSPQPEWHVARLAAAAKATANPVDTQALVERRLAEMKAEEEKMPGYFSPEDQERHRRDAQVSAIPGLSVEDINAPAREAQRQAQAQESARKATQEASYADWGVRVRLQEQRDREAEQERQGELRRIGERADQRQDEINAASQFSRSARSQSASDPMMHPHGSRAPDGVDAQWYYDVGERRWAAQLAADQAVAAAAQQAAAQQQSDWQLRQQMDDLRRRLDQQRMQENINRWR